jgi:hypothetical protein
MQEMKKLWIALLLVVFALAACKNVPTADDTNTSGSAQATSDSQTAPVAEDTEQPEPIQAASTDGKLWVKIDQPTDGEVLNTTPVMLKGSAPVGTTLTINDDILYLENVEDFTSTLNLTIGVNLIEIVASDVLGNELDLFLTVYYEP